MPSLLLFKTGELPATCGTKIDQAPLSLVTALSPDVALVSRIFAQTAVHSLSSHRQVCPQQRAEWKYLCLFGRLGLNSLCD